MGPTYQQLCVGYTWAHNPRAPSGPMDPVSVDRSMLTSAGPTAHVSKSDPPGDVMITA